MHINGISFNTGWTCNLTKIASVPSDFQYSYFIHIFNTSFQFGLTCEPGNINASTPAGCNVVRHLGQLFNF